MEILITISDDLKVRMMEDMGLSDDNDLDFQIVEYLDQMFS